MQQAQARAEDLKLEAERQLICKGSALVRFEFLKWTDEKKPNVEHVEHVKRIFRTVGCRPLYTKHHIPAIVDQRHLDAALERAQRKSRWKSESLPSNYAIINKRDGYPELDFPDGIRCLHGRHRIQAGKEWLPPTEKWWIVDLYLSGITYDLETLLIEEYSYEEKPCDGEIYRKIREYSFLPSRIDSRVSPTTCVSLEMRWWARFKESREKKLRSLFRNLMLAAGFDALARIPELFDAGMMVTTLHKILAMKCYEEVYCYLKHIREVWEGFLIGVENGFARIDKVTVKFLELRAPGTSTLDAEFLRGRGGQIFSGFSTQEQAIIWGNVFAFKGIIPSLFKFFQDIHFLQACIDGLKWLVTVPPHETLFSMLGKCYTGKRDNQGIQITETTFSTEKADATVCMRLGYLQLFAFAMRHHQILPKAPIKKNLKTIPRVKADQEVLRQFAVLAKQLGFNSPEIGALERDPNTRHVSNNMPSVPLLVTTGPGEIIKQRCGLPHTDTFEEDKKHLFLYHLCENKDETGEGITSFFVLKSWFTAFFDPPLCSPLTLVDGQQISEDANMAGEDANMADERLEPPFHQQEIGTDTHMQETVELGLQSGHVMATSQTLQEDRETSFGDLPIRDIFISLMGYSLVPKESRAETKATETEMPTAIRFIELDDNGREHVVCNLEVDHDHPANFIKLKAQDFLRQGKRTCDVNKRYVSIEECYSVATRQENKNTLLLIPDIGREEEMEQEQDRDALASVHQLSPSPTIIILKRQKKGKTQVVWSDYTRLEVPHDDPNNLVRETLRKLQADKQLEPFDSKFRRLGIEDCYKVAMRDENHFIYLKKALGTAHGLAQGLSSVQKEKERTYENSQYKRNASLEQQTMAEKLSVPQFPHPTQGKLISSMQEVHRDKIGRGPNLSDNTQNRVGMNFKDSTPQIRKGPDNMRDSDSDIIL